MRDASRIAKAGRKLYKFGFSSIILVCANGSTCPTVIGTAKNKDYVGGAEVVNTGDKRTVGVISFLVTGMTDGRAGIRNC